MPMSQASLEFAMLARRNLAVTRSVLPGSCRVGAILEADNGIADLTAIELGDIRR
jgi:hypothetical protein